MKRFMKSEIPKKGKRIKATLKTNDEFKNKVDSILNENRLNGGNNEI